MEEVVLVNKDETKIPDNVLCTFGKKVSKGMFYFVGYKRDGIIRVHFSIKRHELKDIVSYQPILNTKGKKIIYRRK